MWAKTFNTNGPEDGREEIVQPSTSLLRDLVRKKDFYAGGLMLLVGIGIALKGSTYRLGSLMHMGPGFMPTGLGILLMLLGIAIGASALVPAGAGGEEESQSILPDNPQWWAWFCILMSPVLFIFFGRYFGMAPGTFACVFIAALGDRTATWKATFILSTVVTVFGVGLFSYFLQVPMPIFTWGGGL
jgi:heme A synthase